MNILVLGGTGAIGAYFTSVVSEFASRVVVTSRRSRESFRNIHYVQGDAKDDVFLSKLLEDEWDAIVDFMIYSTDSFSDRQELLLSRTEQYVYLSSARIYADSDGALDESSPRLLDVSDDRRFLSTDAYPLAKARQEDILLKSRKKNWTIIRPYITYGAERLQLGVLEKEAWMYRGLRGRTVVFSEDVLRCQTTLTHGNDVARAIAKLIGETAALGEAFHITEPQSCSWESILEIYNRAMDACSLNFKVKNVDLDSFIRCHNGIYQITYDRLYRRVFSNKKIDEFIDTAEFTPVETGLYQSAVGFLQDPQFLAVDWSREGVKDRITGELTDLREIGDMKNTLRYLKHRFIK